MADIRFAFRPFPEQVRYFNRKVNIPTARWGDLWHGDHAHGFMVAGATRAELLADLREAVRAAIEGGETLADFRARFDEIVARNGWTGWTGEGTEAGRAWRARVIYRTNLRTSYMAGRWEQLQAFPYLQYRHHTVDHPREQHQDWDGMILRAIDPWWRIHYPPNGWGCNCDVVGISAARFAMLRPGGEPDPTPDIVEGDPPPEWSYHVGQAARSLPAASQLGERVMALPDDWRETALTDAQSRPTEQFGDWAGVLDRAKRELEAGDARPRGFAQPVGFLLPDVASALEAGAAAGQSLGSPTPITALLGVRDSSIYHLARDRAGPVDPAIWTALAELPQRLADPQTTVLWDVGMAGQRNANPGLVYAWPVPNGSGRWVKFVFGLNERQARQQANWLRTAIFVAARNLLEAKYVPIRRGGL